jgi:hypothetical protein
VNGLMIGGIQLQNTTLSSVQNADVGLLNILLISEVQLLNGGKAIMKLFKVRKQHNKVDKGTAGVTSRVVIYDSDEICPVCGVYTVDGSVCFSCLAEYDLQKPKNIFLEL